MSQSEILFALYLFIGLILMIVALASRGHRDRTKAFSNAAPGDEFSFAIMIFIALLWPIWVIAMIYKDDSQK